MGFEQSFENFRNNANDLYDEAYYVLLSKQRDYGPNNIRLSPFGEMQGLLTRINDKVQRAVHLVNTDSDGENESLRDTFLDLMNYGAIGVMLIDDTFPAMNYSDGEEEEYAPSLVSPDPAPVLTNCIFGIYGCNCKELPIW